MRLYVYQIDSEDPLTDSKLITFASTLEIDHTLRLISDWSARKREEGDHFYCRLISISENEVLGVSDSLLVEVGFKIVENLEV